MHAPSTTITLLVLAPLVIWRVYARFRRMVGRQRLSKYRAPITLTIFPLLVVLIALHSLPHPLTLSFLGVGLLVGASLGVFGLSKTSFEPTPQGLFYTPNAHLGIALSLLFVARIAYRAIQVYLVHPEAAYNSEEFARSPLTMAVFGLLAGYYISYAVGLALWRASVLRRKRVREAAKTMPNLER